LKRKIVLLSLSLLVLLSLVSACGAIKPGSTGANPLLSLLAEIPADPVNQSDAYLYFTDLSALESAYNATRPANAEEFSKFEELGESYTVWYVGIRQIQNLLISQTFMTVESMPEKVGFSTLDVDQSLTFGTPPGNGLILAGTFDQEAVSNAYQDNLGMASTVIDKFTLWCAEADCSSGTKISLDSRMRENPFGGDLGQRQPMSISDELLMASPDLDLVLAHLAAAAGKQPSLADDAAYRSAVNAVARDADVIQATIANPVVVERIANQQPMDDNSGEAFQELPPFELFILADVVTEDEQIARLGFVYQDTSAAETAAPILLERLANHPTIQYSGKTVGEMLAERDVTEPRSYVVKEAGRVVLVLEFPTRKATTAEIVPMREIGNQYTATVPGMVYRLFMGLIISNDTGWMSTIKQAELVTTKVGTLVGQRVTMSFSDIADGVVEEINFGGIVIIELEDGTQVDAILSKSLWSQVTGGMKLEIATTSDPDYWEVIRIVE